MTKYTKLNLLVGYNRLQAFDEAVHTVGSKPFRTKAFDKVWKRVSTRVTRRLADLEGLIPTPKDKRKVWNSGNLVTGLIFDLNEYQIETIVDALNESQKWVLIYQRELETFYQTCKVPERSPLIESIIIPFNTQCLTTDITDRIDNGQWTVMYVEAGDDEPAFAYTVGLVNLIGKELLVSNIFFSTAASILNGVAQQLINGVEHDKLDIMVTPEEHRIVYVPLEQACEEMPLTVKSYCRVNEEHQLMVIVLADANSRLPGDDDYNEEVIQYYMDWNITVSVTEPTEDEKQIRMSPGIKLTFSRNQE